RHGLAPPATPKLARFRGRPRRPQRLAGSATCRAENPRTSYPRRPRAPLRPEPCALVPNIAGVRGQGGQGSGSGVRNQESGIRSQESGVRNQETTMAVRSAKELTVDVKAYQLAM